MPYLINPAVGAATAPVVPSTSTLAATADSPAWSTPAPQASAKHDVAGTKAALDKERAAYEKQMKATFSTFSAQAKALQMSG